MLNIMIIPKICNEKYYSNYSNLGVTKYFSNTNKIGNNTPSDVIKKYSGAMFIPSITTCFSDSAGTTPAVKDGVVGCIIDSAGSAYYASQATTGYKPILRKGAKNLLTYSEQFDNAAWGKAICTVGSPDAYGLSLITPSSASTAFIYSGSINVPAGVDFTLQLKLRAGTSIDPVVRIMDGGLSNSIGRVAFSVSGGVFTVSSIIGDVRNLVLSTDVHGDYYISFTVNTGAYTTLQTLVYASNTNTTNTVYAGHAQLEIGSTASTYVATTSAPASNGVGNWWFDYDQSDDLLVTSSLAASTTLGWVFTTQKGKACQVSSAAIYSTQNIGQPDIAGIAFVPGNMSMSEVATLANYMNTLSGFSSGTAATTNSIGTPGAAGFGVGICPALPAGYEALPGYDDPTSANYGNYRYSDGSVMVWVPAFYYRINDARNPTYAGYTTNSVDVQPYSAFADVAAANAAGYALHRAFYDAGSIQPGFFIDKYQASNNSGTASSIKNASPLSTHTDHNPISALAGSPPANYSGCFAAAKTRGAAFFPAMRYQYAALALLALAHGQAATSNAWCAWYDAAGTTNFPKGCNNNALKDANDATVKYVSDGYSNCGKTGSATNFAKTTHNGQDSGVADLNGNMWEVSPGITCVSGTKAITGATQANPVALTVTGHGLSTGAIAMIASVGGMSQINDKLFAITVVDANTITLQGTDGTAFSAYTSGGTLTSGTFYALNTTATAKDLTGSNTLATDQWGATGVAAHSTAIVPTFRTDYAQNGFYKRVGKSTNQVLSAATSGDGWSLTGLGVPMASGISDGTTGTNLFGNDSMHQYIRNELCLISGAGWDSGSAAGVWAASWYGARAGSSDGVGFRAASYL